MIDSTQDDICRYYGGIKPINGLGGSETRNRAQTPVAAMCGALIAWAKGKPQDIRWRVYLICLHLRRAVRGSPLEKEIAASVIECQIKQLRQTAA